MSTFTSAWPKHPRRINIDEMADGANIFISDPLWDDEYGITIAQSDAPALALAILEAAGVEPDREPLECQVSLGTIVADLQGAIQYAEALASANREQAELEAEALDLFNLWLAGFNYECYSEWTGENAELKGVWLAVARKSRELGERAEK